MKYLSILVVSILLFSCDGQTSTKKVVPNSQKVTNKSEVKTSVISETNNVKVTFIELGSVHCIPCKKMEGVIKSVEKKYGDQINSIFYDVWTPEGAPYADTYKIDLIPTQIFLDKTGKEYYRHQGFFPEKELVKILMIKGVN